MLVSARVDGSSRLLRTTLRWTSDDEAAGDPRGGTITIKSDTTDRFEALFATVGGAAR